MLPSWKAELLTEFESKARSPPPTPLSAWAAPTHAHARSLPAGRAPFPLRRQLLRGAGAPLTRPPPACPCAPAHSLGAGRRDRRADDELLHPLVPTPTACTDCPGRLVCPLGADCSSSATTERLSRLRQQNPTPSQVLRPEPPRVPLPRRVVLRRRPHQLRPDPARRGAACQGAPPPPRPRPQGYAGPSACLRSSAPPICPRRKLPRRHAPAVLSTLLARPRAAPAGVLPPGQERGDAGRDRHRHRAGAEPARLAADGARPSVFSAACSAPDRLRLRPPPPPGCTSA